MSPPAHIPVMLPEVLAALAPAAGQVIIDATFGAGGYSRALLASGALVIAFDRDPAALAFAQALARDMWGGATSRDETGREAISGGEGLMDQAPAGGPRLRLIPAPFSRIGAYVGEGEADGVVLDLGLSSMQLDQAERGFSLMRDGPLDMRMSSQGLSAADLVNGADPAELVRIFREYGEEPQARRVAGALVRRRAQAPFERTLDLAEVVERALGGRRGARVHPATRVFQALRMAVNDELAELRAGLAAAEQALKPGGRLAAVSFHSLEDRIVKSFLGDRAGRQGEGSRHAPPRAQGPAPSFTLPRAGALAPGAAEIAANPRARSAKLRAAIRTAAPAWRLAA